MAKFEITRTKDGGFKFNLKARNGEVILSSEVYVAKASCQKGIAAVIKNSTNPVRYQRLISKNKKPYFNLKARNGQIIGTSEVYESEAGRENGIKSVTTNAPKAKIVDLTK